MSGRPGTIKQAWLRWKSLKLPWRKQWLVGMDLAGNTFWEFKETANADRLRRIVKYSRTPHFADVKISPMWIQWLRHTRPSPPTIAEQQLDEIRIAQMKQLAAAADERWKSLPSVLDGPEKAQAAPALQSRTDGARLRQSEQEENEGVIRQDVTPEEVRESAGVGEEGEVRKGRFKGETRERDLEGQMNPMLRTMPEEASTPDVAFPDQMNKKAQRDPWAESAKTKERQPEGWTPKPARRRR